MAEVNVFVTADPSYEIQKMPLGEGLLVVRMPDMKDGEPEKLIKQIHKLAGNTDQKIIVTTMDFDLTYLTNLDLSTIGLTFVNAP